MWKKFLVGCLVIFVVGAAALSGLAYWFFKSSFGKNPELVAQEIAPGLKIPTGFEPGMGMEVVGTKTAIFDDKTNHRQLILVLIPNDPKGALPQKNQVTEWLKTSMDAEDAKKGRHSSKESSLEVKSQLGSFPCLKRLVSSNRESVQWKWLALAWGPTDHKHQVMIMGQAPESLPDDGFFKDVMADIRLEPCYAEAR